MATSLIDGPSVSPALKIVQIERRKSADLSFQDFVAEYVDRNRPVIIEDAVPAWRALHTWTPEFFRSEHGAKTVQVSYGSRMEMGDLIDAVIASTRQEPGPYLHKVIIPRDMPELMPDITPGNQYGFPKRFCSPLMPPTFRRPDGFLKLLIGGVGGQFPLMHFDSDNAHAMITEIYGHKEFVLFAPEDTACVYPKPNADSPVASVDNLDEPDMARFPLFANAVQHRAIIAPGEAAFIPSRWWHSARVVSASISVCTNMIHSSNWDGFVRETCNPSVNRKPLQRFAKRTYLNAAGVLMNTAERLQEKFPGGAFSGPLSVISPEPLP